MSPSVLNSSRLSPDETPVLKSRVAPALVVTEGNAEGVVSKSLEVRSSAMSSTHRNFSCLRGAGRVWGACHSLPSKSHGGPTRVSASLVGHVCAESGRGTPCFPRLRVRGTQRVCDVERTTLLRTPCPVRRSPDVSLGGRDPFHPEPVSPTPRPPTKTSRSRCHFVDPFPAEGVGRRKGPSEGRSLLRKCSVFV